MSRYPLSLIVALMTIAPQPARLLAWGTPPYMWWRRLAY